MMQHPHRRRNALTGEWVLVSPQRTQRPWQGQVEPVLPNDKSQYDPTCYLCPGNARAAGNHNPPYENTFAFDNDFPALIPDVPSNDIGEDDLRIALSERGVARVVCFSPRHDLALSRMPVPQIQRVVDTWCDETTQLASLPFIHNILIFENRGPMAGASNPHPHCQIWATESIPNEVLKEQRSQQEYLRKFERCLLCDYIAREAGSERLIYENASFLVVIPFWAAWPFETLILPKRHTQQIDQLSETERLHLAEALRNITIRYDNLFESECPYCLGIHQQPVNGEAVPGWHFHIHIAPPVLRSASIRKFMVGFEMFGTPGRDLSPEAAAERLRSVSEIHYLERNSREDS